MTYKTTSGYSLASVKRLGPHFISKARWFKVAGSEAVFTMMDDTVSSPTETALKK